MTAIELHTTSCAICATQGDATELYPANFDPAAFSPAVFSARRLPDRVHYRIVRCDHCGLVRSDPVADPQAVASLYQQSTFDYEHEVDNLTDTYGVYLKHLERFGVTKDSILEIGCGNGFFLQEAGRQKYRDLRGVEPSHAAVRSAAPSVQAGIVCSMMQPGLFPNESFDVICLFQVLDHIFDPASMIETCRQILKPGGFVLCLNHDVAALSARLMKDRSPIIDIEHTYLYDRKTISRLFSRCGFRIAEAGSVRNRYSLGYLTRLVPLPKSLKRAILKVLSASGMARIPVRVPLGNLFVIAQKPSDRGNA